ncbi:HAD family phosphatase [bacterium]|nr:HAD family phosphatase [bacterium]
MNANNFKAALFDLDGVLIDSMPAHVRAWKQVLSEYGMEVDENEIKLREGEKAQFSAGDITRKHNLRLTEPQIKSLVARKRDIYRADAPSGMVEGASQLLRRLKKNGYKLALVTGSILENIRKVIDEDELALFDIIITSDIVENSKPHPEPFLKAAAGLNLPPSDCLVIENAPKGIHSAKTAGMTVIAITSTLSKDYLIEADYIMGDFIEIANFLNIKI